MDEAQGLSTRPERKSIRLPRDAYAVSGSAWLLTMTTAERRSHFTDPVFAGAVAALRLEVSDARGVQIDLYCFMPDHAHVPGTSHDRGGSRGNTGVQIVEHPALARLGRTRSFV